MSLRCLLLLCLAALAAPAWAQQSPALDRFKISFGGLDGTSSSSFMAKVQTPQGTLHRQANLEDDVGLKRHTSVWRLQAEGMLGEHVGWSLDYYSTSRERDAGPSYGVPLKGRSVLVTPTSKMRMQVDLGASSYKWWWGQGNDVFGMGLGAAYYHLDFFIHGADNIHYAHGHIAPLVTTGYRHQFNDQWRAYANFGGVFKNTGSSQGHIYHAALGLAYQSTGHFGAGVEYTASHHNIEQSVAIPGGRYTGRVRFNVHGPGAYVSWRW